MNEDEYKKELAKINNAKAFNSKCHNLSRLTDEADEALFARDWSKLKDIAEEAIAIEGVFIAGEVTE